MTATMSVQNWKISSHVTSITVTPFLTIGGKRSISPPKRFEGTAYRGTDSTWNGIAQDMTDCKQKTVFSEVKDISAICKRAAEGFLCSVDEQTPSPHVRSAPFNSGMIASGNHNFERFAALCNTLPGEPMRLRRSGRQVGDPYRCIRLPRCSHICYSCNRPGTVETSVADSPALVYNYGNGNL